MAGLLLTDSGPGRFGREAGGPIRRHRSPSLAEAHGTGLVRLAEQELGVASETASPDPGQA
jgi:hypothetical protein